MQGHVILASLPVLLIGIGCADAPASPDSDSLAQALHGGVVDVEASLNVCPVIDDLSANPLALKLGGVSSLSVSAHDSDNGPAPLAYAWTVNGIKLPRQRASTLSFACSSAGEVTLAALVSDGDPDPTCADTLSVKVTCE